MISYYEMIGVSRNASIDEIIEKYEEIKKQCEKSKNISGIKSLNKIKDTLIDSKKRTIYDEQIYKVEHENYPNSFNSESLETLSAYKDRLEFEKNKNNAYKSFLKAGKIIVLILIVVAILIVPWTRNNIYKVGIAVASLPTLLLYSMFIILPLCAIFAVVKYAIEIPIYKLKKSIKNGVNELKKNKGSNQYSK